MPPESLRESSQGLTPVCPDFSKIIRKSEITKSVNGKSQTFVRFSPTFYTQTLRVLTTALNVLAFMVLVLMALYLPDYVFDYSQRSGDFGEFFLIYLGSLLAGVVLIGMIVVMFSPRICYVGIEAKRMVFAQKLSDATFEQAGVRFDEIESVELQKTTGFLGTHKVAVLARGEYWVLAESKKFDPEFDALVNWLKAILPNRSR